ncbi:MAG: ATP-binding protein, partial [Promethearchaeota archaeon]
CQTQMEIEQLDTVLMPPKQCANPNCKNKKGFIVIAKDSKFIDWQSITIQELPEELQPGRVPYSVKGILTHDLVDKVRPGDRVKITGIYKTYPTEDRRGKKTTLFRSYIKILSIEGTSANDESLDITPEELAEIKRWSLKPDIQKIIANSVAPSILGNEHLKLAAALALFGGVRKILRDGSARRGDIHVLFVGDPGTGKSQILKQCALIAPQPVYTSGKGSSAAGLTAAVVKESDSGGLSLEAGAIVLADGGNAMIDEFDKMDKKDRVAIHEAMEQQTVSVAKAGIIATLRARTSIIAAANPKKGRYDIYKTPKENINLSPPILSRFDLIFVVKDEPDDERDERIADFILSLHSDLGANTGANPNQQAYIPIPLLKKYIQYAKKNVFPKLTPEAIEVIKNFYIELRKSNANNENSAVAVVARSLEGYIRLAEAYAKMALRSYVTKEDAEEAVKLARKSIEDISLDPITGTINADRIYTDKPSTKSMVDKILSFLKQKVEELGGPVKEDDFIEDLLIEVDLDEKKLRYYIDLLINNGVVYRPRDGLLAIIAGNKKQDDGN